MRDFLNQPLSVGDYLVKMGKGNGPAEYGMILHRIDGFGDGTVVTSRLSIRYHPEVTVRHTTARTRKLMSLVKVTPHPNQVKVFENPEDYLELVGTWLHGQRDIDWDAV